MDNLELPSNSCGYKRRLSSSPTGGSTPKKLFYNNAEYNVSECKIEESAKDDFSLDKSGGVDRMNESGDLFSDEEFEDFISSLPAEVMSGSQPLPGEASVSQVSHEYTDQILRCPNHILEIIFSCLPIADMYNARLVCTKWKNLISNEKFMIWKKTYNEVRQEVESENIDRVCVGLNLVENRFLDDTHSAHIGDVIRAMATRWPFTFSCDDEEASELKEKIRSHNLYDLACDVVFSRIYETKENGDFDQETLWMITATIALLSPDISSLEHLQRLLLCVFQMPDVLEFFYAAATYTWILQTHNVISPTLHYKLFCCIASVENASTPQPTRNSMMSSMSHLTHEQLKVVNHPFKVGDVVRVLAYAGTGKTSTLIACVEAHPKLKFLYTSFNKSVVDQGKVAFLSRDNVRCFTMHSMAYRGMSMGSYRYKIGRNALHVRHVREKLSMNEADTKTAHLVKSTILTFVASKDSGITLRHVPVRERVKDDSYGYNYVDVLPDRRQFVLRLSKNFWQQTSDLTNRQWLMTDDCYLKQWQLTQPIIDDYDVILLDEAQDCTECMRDILMRQSGRAALLFVGDSHQQIYGFRRAIDALVAIQPTCSYYLTQSFRFGHEIAAVANCILRVFKFRKGDREQNIADKILVGVGCEGSVRGDVSGKSKAILCRTNQEVIKVVLKSLANQDATSVVVVGGAEKLGVGVILDLFALSKPLQERKKLGLYIKNQHLRRYPNLDAVRKEAEEFEDTDLITKILIVKEHGNDIPRVVEVLKSLPTYMENADIIVSTVHKAKGLEFDTVELSDDLGKLLPDIQKRGGPISRHNSEDANILYVAVTRAKKSLIMCSSLRRILQYSHMRYIAPVKLSDVLEDSPTFCVRCQVSISSHSPMAFRQLYVSMMQEEGVLCPRCGAASAPGWGNLLGDASEITATDAQELQFGRVLNRAN